MKTIETKKVSVNEAIDIINRLNYRNNTFVYSGYTRSNDGKVIARHFDGVNPNGEMDRFAIIEFVINGKLEIVRFFNFFRDITVDLQIGNLNYTVGDKGEIEIITNFEEAITMKKATERTALVRVAKNVHKVIHSDDYSSQKQFAQDLRGNGYRVLKIWNRYISEEEASDWHLLNRNPREDNVDNHPVVEINDSDSIADKTTKLIYNSLETLGADDNAQTPYLAKYVTHVAFKDKGQRTELPWSCIAIRSTDFNRALKAREIISAAIAGKQIDIACAPEIEIQTHDFHGNTEYLPIYHAAELDGSEEDTDESIWHLIPDVDGLNDVADISTFYALTFTETIESLTCDIAWAKQELENGISDAAKENDWSAENLKMAIADWQEELDELHRRLTPIVFAPPAPPTPPADDFAVKLAELKAAHEAAVAETEIAKQATEDAELILKAARDAENAAMDKRHNAWREFERFVQEKAKELRDNLLTDDIILAKDLSITNQKGDILTPDMTRIWINYYPAANFIIRVDFDEFGRYDTPAQVEKVIGLLKAAIARGDDSFTFPTIEELNAPPIPDADETDTDFEDSLTRAMKNNLERFQGFCKVGNLTAANNELALYNICRKATREIFSGNVNARDFIAHVNETAPENWRIEQDDDTSYYNVQFSGKTIAKIDSLALTKILTPQQFFEQFKPLVDENLSPRQQFIDDREKELHTLLEMRNDLTHDKERLQNIDFLIEQVKRDLIDAELYLPSTKK